MSALSDYTEMPPYVKDERYVRGKNRAAPYKKKGDGEQKLDKKLEAQWDDIKSALSKEKIRPEELPDLQEWDHTSLPPGFFLVLEGKRRTGKSTFVRWLLQYYLDSFALVWCMTNTKASGYWQKFVGDQFTFSGWQPSAIEELIARNDKIIEQFGEDSPNTMKYAHSLIILDDIISDNIHDDATFIKLAVEGRHHKIAIILMTQDPKAIGPKIRDNCDVAVIFNVKTFRNKESIWHDFMNDTTKDMAYAMLKKWAVNHDALISVQTHLADKVTQEFFKSTCDKMNLLFPDYALGGPKQKEMILEERRKKKEDDERKKHALPSGSLLDVKRLTAKQILKQ